MLALLLIPALLGLAFLFDGDDDSDNDTNNATDDLDTTTLNDTDTDFTGTETGERAIGNDLSNTLRGGGGGDVLAGNGGDDLIDGETGADTLYGGSGNDTVIGGEGDDLVFLGAGADQYTPGDTAADQRDIGDDTINGGVGDDVIVDLLGSNTLTGSGGDDILSAIDALRDDGTQGPASQLGTADNLSGGAGDDALIGDEGDEMTGGTGNDDFYVAIDEARSQDVVTITDFNVSEDSFAVLRLDETSEEADVTFAENTGQNSITAFFNGAEIAVLNGLDAGDIENISVAVFDEADYLARLIA